MKKHIYKTRVRYAEVDQMGVVYYANYLAYLESARTALLREGGYSYARMESEGIYLPVSECHCRYRGAARYDEVISVETTMDYVKKASIKINYEVRNDAGDLILTGYTIHPFVDKSFKIISIPKDIRDVLSSFVEG